MGDMYFSKSPPAKNKKNNQINKNKKKDGVDSFH